MSNEVEHPRLTKVRFGHFKSLRDVSLKVGRLSILVGRNGSGKSNALDGLQTLSRLASGLDIRDALEGNQSFPGVRGGAEGCAPLGSDTFKLGCVVESPEDQLHYEIEIAVRPHIRLVSERLWRHYRSGARKGQQRSILTTDEADLLRNDITGRWDNRKQGVNPGIEFSAARPIIVQASTRVPATSQAGRNVQEAAAHVLAALRAIFILDPVSYRMRNYVRANDLRLRREADNLSAVLGRLCQDGTARGQLLQLLQELYEPDVLDVGTIHTDLDDVMFYVTERLEGTEHIVPAQLMSDGSLRFLAVLAALLGADLDVPGTTPPTGTAVDAEPIIVVEELENGLHPSQADRVLTLIEDVTRRDDLRVLATVHSPAILNALPGEAHDDVTVCYRDQDGYSRLEGLLDMDSYLRIVGEGRLGDAAVRDRLRNLSLTSVDPQKSLEDFIAEIGA